MKFADINPYVRYARCNETGIPGEFISAFDNRIFYCLRGETDLQVGENIYHLKKGSFICWCGGTPYRTVKKSDNLDLLALNFDYTYDIPAREPIAPRAVDEKEDVFENINFSDAQKLNSCLFLENAFFLEEKLLEIVKEYNNMRLFFEEQCSALLKSVLVSVVRTAEIINFSKKNELAEMVLEYIRENYNKPISNKNISEYFNYHPNYINKIVVDYTGMSLHKYLIKCRINAAIAYLFNTEMTISEVAAAVGMPDLKHFSKCFKNITHNCPSDYKMRK